jgi:hypothetical protein
MAIGYICKKCGGPSPVGVGYATNVEAATTTTPVTACPCGYSQEPTPLKAGTTMSDPFIIGSSDRDLRVDPKIPTTPGPAANQPYVHETVSGWVVCNK